MNCLICPDRAWCEGLADCPYMKAQRPAVIRLASAWIAAAVAVCGVRVASAAIDPTTDVCALYAAIGRVESDSGRTSKNWYQLTPRYVRDLERITGRQESPEIYRDRRKQEEAMRRYWDYYGRKYSERTARQPDAEVLSKMHHVGYEGLRTRERRAETYWRKVRFHYDQYRLDCRFKKGVK